MSIAACCPDLRLLVAGVLGLSVHSLGVAADEAANYPQRPIVAKLNNEIARILALPDVQQRMAMLGAEAAASAPDVFQKMIADMVATTATLARKAGIKPE